MITRKLLGSGISGAVRYVMGEGKRDPKTGIVPELAPGENSRVVWYGGTGFGFPIDSDERVDIARRVMEWAAINQASKTKKCTQDCLHLVLAWDIGETPQKAEMEEAAQSALAWLGLADARAIWVAHDDTDHWHLHLVISRISPITGKAFADSFDTVELSAWALTWEREHGPVRCTARIDRHQKVDVELDPEKAIAAYVIRRETFTVFDLNRELTRSIQAPTERRRFIADVLARPDFIRLFDPDSGQMMRYTTRQTLAAEHLATASAARLHADVSHQVSGKALDRVIENLLGQGKVLSSDQLAALQHATRSPGLSIVTGKAGTGKTFTMSAIAAAYAADGYAVQSLAPTNKVASALKRDGLDAATIHSLLGRLDRGDAALTPRSLIMVDEAGMISTRLMARLLSHAEHAGAKVILLGDEKQLASMERGGLFGYMGARYGMAELNEITRQRGAEQRELAIRASQYDFAAALKALNEQGGIVSVEMPEDRIARAAEIWIQHAADTPIDALFVIAVSNADAQAANLAIRQKRRERGDLGADCKLATADGLEVFSEGDRILFSGSAASREGRAAGLVNGNAGTIKHIAGNRISVILDGNAREMVSFTIGKNREAGEFDAIRLGYAGTIFKSQGATYQKPIVLDGPMMRANTAYVALTRHKETVTVVTARSFQPVHESWMSGKEGLEGLLPLQQESAARSYEKWRKEINPEAGKRVGFADYVAFVQKKQAERGVEGLAPGGEIAAMAKRWSRVEDRRAASRFVAQDYQPPQAGRLTPADVREAVGPETFEQRDVSARAPAKTARPAGHAGGTVVPLHPPVQPVQAPAQAKDLKMAQVLPNDEMLQQQVSIEKQRLRDLELNEQRAQAFRRQKELEAEEAKKSLAKESDERTAREGDISSASARYAIALGENYNVFDPYTSLARAAGAEYAAFHRNQEKMRKEMSETSDPAARHVIELRRTIEACDYMAITSDRLAGISIAIVGSKDAPQAVIDRQSAEGYREQAAALRAQRLELVKTIEARIEVLPVDPVDANQNTVTEPEIITAQPAAKGAIDKAPVSVTPSPAVEGSEATADPKVTVSPIASPSPEGVAPAPLEGQGVQPGSDEGASDPKTPTLNLDPSLRRPDFVAAPAPTPVVAMPKPPELAVEPVEEEEKDPVIADLLASLGEGEELSAPDDPSVEDSWLADLRSELDPDDQAGKEVSDQQAGKIGKSPKGKDRDKTDNGKDNGPEPDP